MKEQQTFKMTVEPKPETPKSEVDQAVDAAAAHGDEFESMRQWQIDREIGVIDG